MVAQVLEFVNGPCSWDALSPMGLRRYAAGVPEWHRYSTTRCIVDRDPVAAFAAREWDSPIDPGISIELLPEEIQRKWRNLAFATKQEMIEMGFSGLLAKSLELIRSVPALRGTVAGTCRSLHVLLASTSEVDVSYSEPSLPFSIFVSCPPATQRDRTERLAESVLHEALHLQLTLVDTVTPLVVEGARQTRIFSPWKNEWRELRGLLHSVYVFGNLRAFWEHLAVSRCESVRFARRRVEDISEELDAVRTVGTNRFLSARGRRLAASYL